MSYFPHVGQWRLPTAAFSVSLEEMASDGAMGNEGVALWLGRRDSGIATITHVVALRGPGVIKRPALIDITAALFDDVTDVAIGLGVSLIGQIHSHGPWHGVDLSETDRTRGIGVPGYLSLVAPAYACSPGTDLRDCGVHVFVAQTRYVRLSSAEAVRRVRLEDVGPVPIIVVGK